MQTDTYIDKAAKLIANASHAIVFSGAGISLESGIPTFRGATNGIWAKYDPDDIEISNFMRDPAKSWKTIKACFYDFIKDKDIQPNIAHRVIADLQKAGIVKAIITQNIDSLHQRAGATDVIEFHGTTATASCTKCGHSIPAGEVDFTAPTPSCPKCKGLLKPDFVFFGEGIPRKALDDSFDHAAKADLCIVVGTSAQVMPAGMIPINVKRAGGKVIEINPQKSAVTDAYSDVFIPLPAVDAFTRLAEALKRENVKF